jgi:hypothetical protein
MVHKPHVDDTNLAPGVGERWTTQLLALVIPFVAGFVVIALFLGVLLSVSGGRPGNLFIPGSGLQPAPTSEPLPTRTLPYPEVPRISVQAAAQGLEEGLILVDVRSKSVYDKAHASGALSVPEDELESRLAELPLDRELALYCT